MAGLEEIKIKVLSDLGEFCRVRCDRHGCKYHEDDSFNCNLKRLEIDYEGQCIYRKDL